MAGVISWGERLTLCADGRWRKNADIMAAILDAEAPELEPEQTEPEERDL